MTTILTLDAPGAGEALGRCYALLRSWADEAEREPPDEATATAAGSPDEGTLTDSNSPSHVSNGTGDVGRGPE
jgi:hypothetical protein